MSKEKFNLCDSCLKAAQDTCSMYRKNPKTTVVDCGRFVPDSTKTSLAKIAAEVMNRSQ